MNNIPFDQRPTGSRNLSARLHTKEVGELLGFPPHDIPILVAAKLLKPLGTPSQNGVKFYAAATILELWSDQKWLDRATKVIAKYWKDKNALKKRSPHGASDAA